MKRITRHKPQLSFSKKIKLQKEFNTHKKKSKKQMLEIVFDKNIEKKRLD
jgi:hypothetical protein